MSVARVSEAVLERTVVREQHQALGVSVEQAGRIEIWSLHELSQRLSVRLGRGRKGETTHHIKGFVQHNNSMHPLMVASDAVRQLVVVSIIDVDRMASTLSPTEQSETFQIKGCHEH